MQTTLVWLRHRVFKRAVLVSAAALSLFSPAPTYAQGIAADVLAGKLINPEVGAYSWYELHDASPGKKFFLRQAIVGEEDVKKEKGYWVETEIRPEIGFPSIYKMLLTGPASDPRNIHKIISKEGEEAPQVMPVPDAPGGAPPADAPRKLVGKEKIVTADGEVETEHYELGEGDKKAEVWLNDTIPPMGIVRFKNSEGELILRNHGKGGKDGSTAIDLNAPQDKKDKTKVEVRVSKGSVGAEGATKAPSASKETAPADKTKKTGKKKK